MLQKLILKQNALDEFNLPVKTVAGHIGELVLKIPWTNLYSAPSHINIKGLYLLAVPNDSVVYDEQKEQLAAQETKKRLLARIEEAKLAEAASLDAASVAAQDSDGFVAKLAAQILQNLHVTIEDVHVRYEDDVTQPGRPFAVGVTLQKLALESTDASWTPRVVAEPSRQFFKLVSLEHLSLYWLSDARPLLHRATAAEQLEHFQRGVANSQHRPYENWYPIRFLRAV